MEISVEAPQAPKIDSSLLLLDIYQREYNRDICTTYNSPGMELARVPINK
jgi:hypothetical protein